MTAATTSRLSTALLRPGVQRSMILFVAGGVVFYMAGLFWSGWEQTIISISKLGWMHILFGGIVASSSYLWRFVRWQNMLSVLRYSIAWRINLPVYLAGLALTTSPGKLGETVRSVFLLPYGVRVADSLAAFLTDRTTDVVGVCLLGAWAGYVYGAKWEVPAVIGLVVILITVLMSYAVRHSACGCLWAVLISRLRRLPVHIGQSIFERWAILWSPRRVMYYTLCALFAYGVQALVFFGFCIQLDIAVQPAQAVSIFTNATLLGAASMVPGGLGAMEAALVYQLVLAGVTESEAVAAAILTRVVTLWLGMLIGVVALIMASRRSALEQREM